MDINRRLNDLLNQKDEEIVQLNNQIMELKLGKGDLDSGKLASPKGKSLFKPTNDVIALE